LHTKQKKRTIIGIRGIILIMACVIALGAGVVFINQIHSRTTQAEPVSREIPVPVQVHRVGVRSFQDEVTGVAFLKAKTCSLVSSNASGNIKSILSDMGSRVDKGQPLAQVDPTHYELAVGQARAALDTTRAGLDDLMAWSRPEDVASLKATTAQAKTRLEEAERNYERLRSLFKDKAVSESDFKTVEANYEAALYGYQAAQENLKKAEAGPTPTALNLARSRVRQAQESLTQAMQGLHDTTIRAPIDGTVVMRNVELGQTVAPGMVLFKIVDNTHLVADVDISEKAFGLIHVGMDSELQVDALKGMSFKGRVVAVNSMVNPLVHTFTVRVEIDNPAEKLIDGMYCRVRFNTVERSALAVPRRALLRTMSPVGDYVFLVEEGKAVKRPVKTGSAQDYYVEVREGLLAWDMVVMSGVDRIHDGSAVQIRDEKRPDKGEL